MSAWNSQGVSPKTKDPDSSQVLSHMPSDSQEDLLSPCYPLGVPTAHPSQALDIFFLVLDYDFNVKSLPYMRVCVDTWSPAVVQF